MKFLVQYKVIGVLVLLLVILSSCEKMLDVKTPANQIGKDKVFTDVQTANAALAALYAGLRDNSLLSGDALGPVLGVYTDDLDFYTTATPGGMMELYTNQLTAGNQVVHNQWSTAYQLIYSCNAIIEGCDHPAAAGAEDMKTIKGEALLIRSILFYYLQQLYGDIPCPLSTDYKINQSLSRMTSPHVLQLLENQLSEASALLQDAYRNPERIYLNKKAAQLMLARVYMLQQRWTDAATLCENIIGSDLYQIRNDVASTFKKSGNNIIWQLKPMSNGDATKEAIIYYFDFIPPYSYALSNDLMNSFSSSDLRKQHWTLPVTVDGTTWYRANKYKNLSDNLDEYAVVFRIEEVYLLLAEALGNQDKVALAAPFLNATRIRSNLPEIEMPMSKDDFLDEVLAENRREFFTEMGHRFFDMKRMKKLHLLTATKPNWKLFHSEWPVPQKELLLNPNLKPQNNGY
ncbi:RagB/SusD family nutrient uptake outer membrane protein [Chitinophaga qingshengii]|uniref:RagB/SusD family nutrient uptake outer membrane protein n=1 Tax=Chitinophaga qingshengii TaxID=1569794 RepID=A0ABR7TJC4_9BACT|nr:RagB/SusD family nutrient uptake outer membrane protein [Chitinophaga qingshengii]MBC9929154.1 RagB/SusD family nutrient uptake outer membrane protein [Chitinophaga qingshengii]